MIPHLRFAIFALLTACGGGHPAYSATVETWSGAGPHACRDRCSLEWAETLLTKDERAQLQAVQSGQPAPEMIAVPNGTVFTLMSYYKDGAPIGYRTTTVAVLDHDEYSWGWQMDGWAFVKLVACGNWAIVRGHVEEPIVYVEAPFSQPRSASILTWTPVDWPTPIGPTPWTPTEPPVCCAPPPPCCVVPPPLPPSPVPVPASAVLLASAIAALTVIRRKGIPK